MKINNIIIYSVSALFALSLLFFLVSTVYSSLDSVSSENLQQRLSEYEKRVEHASDSEEGRKQWRNISQVIDDFKGKYMIKMGDFSKFRSQLPLLFMKHNLRLMGKRKVNLSYKPLFSDIIRAHITFGLNGTYADFKRFIHEMNTSDYKDKMVLFRHIQLSKKEVGDISGDFGMEVYIGW